MYFEFQPEARAAATWAPTVDVCERPAEIVIFVEVPGVNRSDIQLAWDDGLLVISGMKRQQPPDRGVAYLCVERSYGHFRREITINVRIDYKQAKAELKDGLLKIHLPKLTSKPEASVIPIL
jgi:HSP20 family protein